MRPFAISFGQGEVMASQINRYGLTRASMSEAVRRAVRQRCGFGCVVCGNAFIEYDHFEPEFAEATTHDPEHIVLLCLLHHGMKTKSSAWLSDELIRRAAATPKATSDGFSTFEVPQTSVHPTIVLGELTCIEVGSLIEVDGESILSIEDPEAPGAPYRVSARLSDASGTEILEIERNEVKASSLSWDVRLEGARLRIWEASRRVALHLRFEPNKIVVERLDMEFRGLRIQIQDGNPTRLEREGQALSFYRATVRGSRVAARFDGRGVSIGVGGGSVQSGAMSIGSGRPQARDSTLDRVGGISAQRLNFPPGVEALAPGHIGIGGAVARRFCRLPANDDIFAVLP